MDEGLDEGCETDSSTDLGYEAASEDPGVVLEREEPGSSHVRAEELRDIVDSLSLEQLRRLVLSAASTHENTLTEVGENELGGACSASDRHITNTPHTRITQVVSAAEAIETESVVSGASTASLNVWWSWCCVYV